MDNANKTKTKAAKMTNLLESCSGTAEFVRLVRGAVQGLFADDVDGVPVEFAALEAALYAAEEAAQALDDATA